MVKDIALLSALEEIDEGRVKTYLDELLKEFFDNLIAESNRDEVLRIQGALRILNRIIKDIETASQEKAKLRKLEGRPDPKHLF